MNYYWYFIALAIGYYYAQKQGGKAEEKVNQYLEEKANQNTNV
jgi:hypothetical protein